YAFAPKRFAKIIADFALTIPSKAQHIARDLAIVEDGLVAVGGVSKYFRPMRHEGLAVARIASGKRRHAVGVLIKLLLEEDRQVCFLHVSERHFTGHYIASTCM